MTTRRGLLVFVSCAVLHGPAKAAVDQGTAESLMKKSGIWMQLDDIASAVRAANLAAFTQRRPHPGAADVARVSRALESAYSVKRLRSACVDAVSRDLDAAHVAVLRRWYDGPRGQAIARIEMTETKRDPRALLERGSSLLGTMRPARRRLLDEMVLASRSAEIQTNIAIGTALASRQGAASISPNGVTGSIGELREQLESRRQELMRRSTAVALASSAAMYAPLADAQLEEYIAFLESDAGAQYLRLTSDAFTRAMIAGAAQLGSELAGSRKGGNT